MGKLLPLKHWLVGALVFLSVPVLGATSLPVLSTPRVEAATISTVKAVRPVYLRRGPQIANNAIRREATGTRFTIITGSTSGWWHVRDPKGTAGYVIRKTYWIQPVQQSTSGYAAVLPPGVKMDPKIRPIAGLKAARSQKFNAVLRVAKSKLGTPYRWGHNEDRGQYGFDCSNFTAYVYHHALGYKMSGASKVQASSVGWRVSRAQMRPGDLLIFNGGTHVGIYIGNNRMIQEGGGLGKVGYLSVGPGSYWGKHITAVKRMYK